jgi:hypothetical protein
MRDSRFALARFIVLALLLGHWVSTGPSSSPGGDIVNLPSLVQLDAQSVIVSNRGSGFACFKQSRANRLSHVACDAAPVVSAAALEVNGLGLVLAGKLERIVASTFPAYRARAPPTA